MKEFNIYKHLINVDMIESFLITENLTKNEFCYYCDIDIRLLNDILNRNLSFLPQDIYKICNFIHVEFENLVNYRLLQKDPLLF